MPVERASGATSLIDVLDRVLDKGVVVDAWARVALVGIDLLTVKVASIDACLETDSVSASQVPAAPGPEPGPGALEDLMAENRSLRAQLAAVKAREKAPARRPRSSSRH